ncbi:hypothetical protein MIND_01383700 [Mycena indigotica]|uniref:Uncharacterized protein n=1 Tax=Mycena indigotica TaxID=2126181 RepID=A0A8H6VUZ2_9AGAR|nr:uncharacterized protein MIND_01383700 [Mycena indigotica]KAF7289224.1 hypothetical protein MIND_01383700 [Mycena indigotica]
MTTLSPVASTSRIPAPEPRHSRRLSLKALSLSIDGSGGLSSSTRANTTPNGKQSSARPKKRKSPDLHEDGVVKKSRVSASGNASTRLRERYSAESINSSTPTPTPTRKSRTKATASPQPTDSPGHVPVHNTRSSGLPIEPVFAETTDRKTPKKKTTKAKTRQQQQAQAQTLVPPLGMRRLTRRTAQLLANAAASATTSASSSKPLSQNQNPMTLRPTLSLSANNGTASRGTSPAPSRLDEIDMGVSPVRERTDVLWSTKKVVVKMEPIEMELDVDIDLEKGKEKERELVCVPVEEVDVEMPLRATPPTTTRKISNGSQTSPASSPVLSAVNPSSPPLTCPASPPTLPTSISTLTPLITTTPIPTSPTSPTLSPTSPISIAASLPPLIRALSPEDFAPSPFVAPTSAPAPLLAPTADSTWSSDATDDSAQPSSIATFTAPDGSPIELDLSAASPVAVSPAWTLPRERENLPPPLSQEQPSQSQSFGYPNANAYSTFSERHTHTIEWNALMLRRRKAGERAEADEWERRQAEENQSHGMIRMGRTRTSSVSPLLLAFEPQAEPVEPVQLDPPALAEPSNVEQPLDNSAAVTTAPESAAPSAQNQAQEALYENPYHMEDLGPEPMSNWHTSWGVWKIACRFRVWEMRSRYSPALIRSLVSREADEFFSATGKPHPQALMFMDEEYYDWELEESDGDGEASGEDEDADDEIDAEGEIDDDQSQSFVVDPPPPPAAAGEENNGRISAFFSQSPQQIALPQLPPPPLSSLRVPLLRAVYTDIPISETNATVNNPFAKGTAVDRVRRALWAGKTPEQGLFSSVDGFPSKGTLERRQPMPRARPHPMYMAMANGHQSQEFAATTPTSPERFDMPMPDADHAAWEEFLKNVGGEETSNSPSAMDVDVREDEGSGGRGGTSGGVSLGLLPTSTPSSPTNATFAWHDLERDKEAENSLSFALGV